jgi:phosphate transport system substrate-binding protein
MRWDAAAERKIQERKTVRHPKLLAVACAGTLAFGAAACGSDSSTDSTTNAANSGSAQLGGTINGAGATFPAPVYSEWASRFKETTGTTVNYQAIGSGGGIAQFTEGTVDFGATDAPMSDEEEAAAKSKGTPVHVPTVLGAVTVAYNAEGVDKSLKLDGQTIADVFLGKVTKWNDPAIAGLNDGVELPATDITVCHRSDESGTTKNFTQFLADWSPEWKNGPGVDKSVKWPTGTGAKGNDGVAGCVKQTDGAIGYVEQAYALQNDFTTAAVKNKAGNFIEPSLDATSAAGEGAKPPADLRFTTIDAPGDQTYPISAVTFLLVYQDMCKAGVSADSATRVKAWLDYALGDGQQIAPQLEYAPLPDAIKGQAQQKVDALQCNGSAIQGA